MVSFELVPTDWFDSDAIRLPDYKVGRVSYGYGRSYLRITDGQLEEPFRLYTSLTTAINTCAPTERPLLEWYAKLGMSEADRQLKISQHYGTLMHIMVGQFLMDNFFDFGSVKEKVATYVSEKKISFPEIAEWDKKLRHDVAAFVQFAHEYKIKPMGIEYVLLSQRGFGTLIDLVCRLEMPVKGFHGEAYKSGPRQGQQKETTEPVSKVAIINFKSGRHGFYRSNGIQAICEKQLFEENFPDIKIECALNWSPKDWAVFPDWNLKDWEGEISDSEINAVLSLAEERFGNKAMDKKYISVSGMAYTGRGIEGNITSINVEEYCKQVYSDYL